MPIRPCPQCGSDTPRLIESTSQIAYVWYYRCNNCGHVWSIPKDDPSAPIRDVTIKRSEQQET